MNANIIEVRGASEDVLIDNLTLDGGQSADDPVVRAGLPSVLSPETVQGALRLNQEITRQAEIIAYIDDFKLMLVLAIVAIPMVLLTRLGRQR